MINSRKQVNRKLGPIRESVAPASPPDPSWYQRTILVHLPNVQEHQRYVWSYLIVLLRNNQIIMQYSKLNFLFYRMLRKLLFWFELYIVNLWYSIRSFGSFYPRYLLQNCISFQESWSFAIRRICETRREYNKNVFSVYCLVFGRR